jgi:hypothetical protein
LVGRVFWTSARTRSSTELDAVIPCVGVQISSQKRRTGVISPKRFIQKLKRDKEQFRSYDEHQVGGWV